jgi:hypothetical protein
MPIMKPEHQRAMMNAQKLMAAAGVEGAKEPVPVDDAGANNVRTLLDRAGLSLEDTIQELAIVAKGANEGLRARAIDTALKMHGALKEAAVGSVPSFQIIIKNDSSQDPGSTNPAGVNPIFIPRQLLQSFSSLEKTSPSPVDPSTTSSSSSN